MPMEPAFFLAAYSEALDAKAIPSLTVISKVSPSSLRKIITSAIASA